jgi:antirestriction protein ArdC
MIVYYGRKEGQENAATGEVEGSYLFARKSYVFNLEQTEGLAERFALPVEPRTEFERVEAAEKIAASYLVSGPSLKHQGAQAFYAPQSDLVAMPPRSTFESAGGYYSTLFHELAHSTGHRARLNRDSLTALAAFGSHEYSREELVAEMTAAFILAETGLDCSKEFDNSAAYLAGWIKVLKGDSKLAIQAASAAEKAANWIQGII